MDIEAIILNLKEEGRASKYFERVLREAHEKYVDLDTFNLQKHELRITQEIRLFGPSFRATAGILVIQTLLSERAIL